MDEQTIDLIVWIARAIGVAAVVVPMFYGWKDQATQWAAIETLKKERNNDIISISHLAQSEVRLTKRDDELEKMFIREVEAQRKQMDGFATRLDYSLKEVRDSIQQAETSIQTQLKNSLDMFIEIIKTIKDK